MCIYIYVCNLSASRYLSTFSSLVQEEQEMEKRQEGNLRHGEEEAKSHVWDCDSSLYDSFELRSFKRQLDSAIVSRTLSMPHLLEVQRQPPDPVLRRSSKISRSLQKLIRSVFRRKPSSGAVVGDGWSENGLYVFHPRCLGGRGLPKIPEVCEGGIDSVGVSPDIDSMVWRSASERFMDAGVAVSCS